MLEKGDKKCRKTGLDGNMENGNATRIRTCPGCHAVFPYQEGQSDRYGVSSPECWATFNKVMVNEHEYADRGYPPIHRLSVDAYAVQHPPHSDYQATQGISQRLIQASHQSIAVHLLALHLALVERRELGSISKLMDQALSRAGTFDLLEPPEFLGKITLLNVKTARTLQEHIDIVHQWAKEVWEAWSIHHTTIRNWCETFV